MQTLHETCMKIVEGTADKNLLHNNANKASERIPVQKNMIAGEVAKALASHYIPEDVMEAHNKGSIHFHDMDESPLFPFYNCCLVDLKGMLTKGFKMGNADIETPKSISTACAITAQIIAQIACHQYGGVSLNRLDEVLEPYVSASYYKHLAVGKRWMNNDKAVVYATELTKTEVMDACQSLEYEVNTLFTSQGQTPFVTFGFGLGTSWQARAIQVGLLETRIRGLGTQGRTAIFPKLVYMMDEGLNLKEGDPHYYITKLAAKCAARRNYPDILNMPMLRASGGGCAPMGCRSFLHEWRHPSTGELVWDGRNNLGVVSINLPQAALQSSSINEFWELLDIKLELAKKALDVRVDRLRGVKAKVAPILYQEGALGFRLKPEDDIFQVFENGRSSISLGYIGLNEMCNSLFGAEVHLFDSPMKQKFAISVVAYLKKVTTQWTKDSTLSYGVYSTPSESLCDRFCRIDQARFGIVEGVTDRDYYTNSFHLDVAKRVSPTQKIDFEKPYHHEASSGHISYTEVPNIPLKLREIYILTTWDYASTRLPYIGTNCVIDYCYKCEQGGDAKATEDGFACPECGNTDPLTLEVTKRVCGYLGSPNARPYNHGKQQEVIQRVKHIQETQGHRK